MKRLVPALVLVLCGCTAGGRRATSVSSPSYGGAGPAPLTAGEVDDNVRLPEYLDYVAAYPHGDVPKIDLTDRRVLRLVDGSGWPLWDLPVRVLYAGREVYAARTTGAGEVLVPLRALGLPPSTPLELDVGYAPQAREVLVASPYVNELPVRGLHTRSGSRADLDIALVVDTTGSMADEIDALRRSLRDVVARIRTLPNLGRLRIGGVAYRDVGDDYVTHPFDFTERMDEVERTLAATRAYGGGDEPEAVHEALDIAVNRLPWSQDGAVRLLFLIGDAAPHLERGTPYTITMRRAVEKGIVIVPVGCSGLDDTGEFVWRQLAAFTLGRFVFLSYGGSTEHHTGPYVENDLDDVLVHAAEEAVRSTQRRSDPRHPPQAIAPAIPPAGYGPNQGPATYAPPPPTWAPPPRIGFGRAPTDFAAWGWPR